MRKVSFFSFYYDIHYANISLRLPTILTASLTCQENLLPRKICITEKTFFPRNFSVVLHDLLPDSLVPKSGYCFFKNANASGDEIIKWTFKKN